jgi:hypothetical protein
VPAHSEPLPVQHRQRLHPRQPRRRRAGRRERRAHAAEVAVGAAGGGGRREELDTKLSAVCAAGEEGHRAGPSRVGGGGRARGAELRLRCADGGDGKGVAWAGAIIELRKMSDVLDEHLHVSPVEEGWELRRILRSHGGVERAESQYA